MILTCAKCVVNANNDEFNCSCSSSSFFNSSVSDLLKHVKAKLKMLTLSFSSAY